MTTGVKGHLRGGDQTSHAHTHYLNREQATSVNCERGIAGGKEGQRQNERKKAEPVDHTDKRVCSVLFPHEGT